MKELNFDTGLVTYDLNGKVEVTFNPSDSNFVERLYSAFEDLDKKQDGYKSSIEKMADKKEIFEFASRTGYLRCGKSLTACLVFLSVKPCLVG